MGKELWRWRDLLVLSPSLLRQARQLALARVNKTELDKAVLLPRDWSLVTRNSQVVIELPESVAHRFRRVYGFVSGATLTESSGTGSPLQFTVVLKLPFYFSGSVARAEENHEWDVELTWGIK